MKLVPLAVPEEWSGVTGIGGKGGFSLDYLFTALLDFCIIYASIIYPKQQLTYGCVGALKKPQTETEKRGRPSSRSGLLLPSSMGLPFP